MYRANQGGWNGLVTQHVWERREIRAVFLIVIYLLTAIGLTPSGSSTVHIYTQTTHRTTQITTEQHK